MIKAGEKVRINDRSGDILRFYPWLRSRKWFAVTCQTLMGRKKVVMINKPGDDETTAAIWRRNVRLPRVGAERAEAAKS